MGKLYMRLTLVALLTSTVQLAMAQLVVTPGNISLTSVSPPGTPVRTVTINDINGAHVQFKFAGVQPIGNLPNFVVVIPSSGTTPALIQIALNPNVVAQLAPGVTHRLIANFIAVDQPPTGFTGPNTGPIVTYNAPAEPPPNMQSIVNSASLQPLLSPGAQVSILGSHLTGPTLSTTYDDTASYPTSVAGTTVTFNGIAAPLLRLSAGKIRAIVPFALAGQTSVEVVVQRFNQRSDDFTLPLEDTAPGIFTSKHGGTGAGPILQEGRFGQFAPNSPDNPAAAGTTLKIFATGAGVWSPPPQSDVFIFGENFTTQPVSLTIGGLWAKISYAGTAGTYNTWSVLQVNAMVPDGLSSGPQPVVLTIGANDSSQQEVTVWVQEFPIRTGSSPPYLRR